MSQLFFEYGVMGSGKSIEILKVAHNYEAQGRNVLLLTPSIDSRDGLGTIVSRIGLKRNATIVTPEDDIFKLAEDKIKEDNFEVILVDESQFLTKENVDELARIVDELHIPVLAFGLKQDAFNNLFPGSKRLLEISDKLVELKTICAFCTKKAVANLRIADGVPQREGSQVLIGSDDKYIPTCRKHWHEPDMEKLSTMFN